MLVAHLAVAFGAELAAGPSAADLVVWSTGVVDLDLRVVDHDYRLAAKARHGAAAFTEAAAGGAAIVALVPACEDPSPLREMLAEAGIAARVETVDGVGRARRPRRRAPWPHGCPHGRPHGRRPRHSAVPRARDRSGRRSRRRTRRRVRAP